MKLQIIRILFLAISTTIEAAPPQIPNSEITILVPALGKEGEKFPPELVKVWETIPVQKDENTIEVIPVIKIVRIDLPEEKEFQMPKFESFVDKFVKPDQRIILKKTHDFLEQSKIGKDFSTEFPSEIKLITERKTKFIADIPNHLEVLKADKLEKNQFLTLNELIEELKKQISKNVLAEKSSKYLILYRLYPDSPIQKIEQEKQVTSDASKVAELEVIPKEEKLKEIANPPESSTDTNAQQHVKQAMVFVSLAKANLTTRSENIKNALAEFDVAVKQEEAQGRCFAKAYMNRGIAYWLDKKLNLAEKDLVKASECDDKDAVIFYNLTSYYSAINKADLALEPLNKALDLGFKDCDILRKDPDLKNLRKMGDFKRALEQHSLFCLK